MHRQLGWRLGLAGVLASASLFNAVATAQPTRDATTADAASGRQLYERAIAHDGKPLAARHGSGGWRLPSAAAACANCHGENAEGGREGAVPPPSLRWVRDDATSRLAIRQALREGRGRDGRTLDPSMPRFDIDDADLERLITHLAHLASPQAQSDRARPLFVTLMPQIDSLLADEQALEAELKRCLGDPSARPRAAWRWRVWRHDGAASAAAKLQSMLDDSDTALVVAPSLRGWDSDFAARYAQATPATRRRWPPVLFPLTAEPVQPPPGSAVHWLFGGAAQRDAAVHTARREASSRATASPAARRDAALRGEAAAIAAATGREPPDIDDAAAWFAVPARQTTSAPAPGPVRSLGTQWGEAACRAVLALAGQAQELSRRPNEPWAAWARRRLSALPRLETIDGFALEPSRSTAVGEWSVWVREDNGRVRLVAPAVSVPTNPGP